MEYHGRLHDSPFMHGSRTGSSNPDRGSVCMICNIFRAVANVVVCQGDAHSYLEFNFGASTSTRA